MKIKSFQDLTVWQKAHQLSLAIYRSTADFPKNEMYGLTSQIRRAAVSVALNIAEGVGRSTLGDYRRFISIARGSSQEVICLLLIARDLAYFDAQEAKNLLQHAREVGKMLSGLLSALSK